MMVDIDNLTEYDPTTQSEFLQQYHAKTSSPFFAYLFGEDRAALRKAESGLTNPFAYYDYYIGTHTTIFRLLITHPDMDHMTGLDRLANEKRIVNFWHTGPDDFNLGDTTRAQWNQAPYSKRDWDMYKSLRAGTSVNSAVRYQNATGHFWTDDGIEIWAPTRELAKLAVERDEPNIISMILKISYKGHSIVLGGDATADDTWPAIHPYIDMAGITVLKASHHGRKSGYYGPAVKEMAPALTITSVEDAEHDATENYRRYSQHTVSLRKVGDIRITITDGGQCQYEPSSVATYWKPRKIA